MVGRGELVLGAHDQVALRGQRGHLAREALRALGPERRAPVQIQHDLAAGGAHARYRGAGSGAPRMSQLS